MIRLYILQLLGLHLLSSRGQYYLILPSAIVCI